MPFWRRRRGEELPAEPRDAAVERGVDPATVEPGWEADAAAAG